MAMAVAGHHFPKMDERKNKRAQALVHRKGEGRQATGWDHSSQAWEGAMALCSSPAPGPTLGLGPD
jgi:hypothetical protein